MLTKLNNRQIPTGQHLY